MRGSAVFTVVGQCPVSLSEPRASVYERARGLLALSLAANPMAWREYVPPGVLSSRRLRQFERRVGGRGLLRNHQI